MMMIYIIGDWGFNMITLITGADSATRKALFGALSAALSTSESTCFIQHDRFTNAQVLDWYHPSCSDIYFLLDLPTIDFEIFQVLPATRHLHIVQTVEDTLVFDFDSVQKEFTPAVASNTKKWLFNPSHSYSALFPYTDKYQLFKNFKTGAFFAYIFSALASGIFALYMPQLTVTALAICFIASVFLLAFGLFTKVAYE